MQEVVVARNFRHRRRCRTIYGCLVWTENCFTVSFRIARNVALIVGAIAVIWFTVRHMGDTPKDFIEYILK